MSNSKMLYVIKAPSTIPVCMIFEIRIGCGIAPSRREDSFWMDSRRLDPVTGQDALLDGHTRSWYHDMFPDSYVFDHVHFRGTATLGVIHLEFRLISRMMGEIGRIVIPIEVTALSPEHRALMG
jgi:hypothetical protein